MPQPTRPVPPSPARERAETLIERAATLIEADEEARPPSPPDDTRSHPPAGPAAPAPTPAAAPPEPTGRAASPYRPTVRPAVALLTVFDDGKTEGETIRIRDHRFVIGRTEGDLTIPIDGRISSRHVEITRVAVGGQHRWVVTDLQSTHGMFVRVSKTVLADKAEILVGNGRYRFDAPTPEAATTAEYPPDDPNRGVTRGWDDGPSPFRPPALTELLGNEIGNRTLLVKNEYWIGSDPTCPICRPDDPFCEARHLRLYRKPQGNWHAEHNRTLNGLWLRMSQITVEAMVHFQIGEQRFQIKLP
jgi:pSer/pThr/pTyr-binding forkhead associated (FHA) protein